MIKPVPASTTTFAVALVACAAVALQPVKDETAPEHSSNAESPAAAAQAVTPTVKRDSPLRSPRVAILGHELRRPAGPAAAPGAFRLCQALGPAAPHCVGGVDCAGSCGCGEMTWEDRRAIDWQAFAQGEYVGHPRMAHVPEYRIRVDDQVEFVYRLTREQIAHPYQLNVGDQVRIESFADPTLQRDLIIQPDGSITLRLLGQVRAAGKTVDQLRLQIDQLYKKFYREPAITVTPLSVDTQLEDLRNAVDNRFGAGGQSRVATVTPEGTVQLPAIGSFHVQGLSLGEIRMEVNARYAATIQGVEVIPVLVQRAPRFIYVVGAVNSPGRYTLEGPTTSMQSIALAGGWIVGANLRQVVVFRRGDDWRLMATMLDLRGPLYGKRPCPSDEIWLNDSDIVVVPRSPVLIADDFIELVFTRGIYGVLPMQGISMNFAKASTL